MKKNSTETIKEDKFAQREKEKYAQPIASREHIIELVKQHTALLAETIAEYLGLSSQEDLEALRRRLIAMLRDGQLKKNNEGFLQGDPDVELIEGTVLTHRDGYGFLKIDAPTAVVDFFIHPYLIRNILHGDRV
jgi:ribonuclease R